MKIEYNDQKSEPSLDAKPEHSRASPAKLERYLRVSSLMPAAFRFALTGIFFWSCSVLGKNAPPVSSRLLT